MPYADSTLINHMHRCTIVQHNVVPDNNFAYKVVHFHYVEEIIEESKFSLDEDSSRITLCGETES